MIIAAIALVFTPADGAYEPIGAPFSTSIKPACVTAASEEMRMSSTAGVGGQAALPFAMGRRFLTLDEYLLHLQKRARPIGLPWYKQVRPDVYELQVGNVRKLEEVGTAQKRIFTRDELERKLGFAR